MMLTGSTRAAIFQLEILQQRIFACNNVALLAVQQCHLVQCRSRKFRFLWKWSINASVSNQFLSAENIFLHVRFRFSAYSLSYMFVSVCEYKLWSTTAAAVEKEMKFVHKKQTNPLAQLNLMLSILFITTLPWCASTISSSSLVHQVKFYWHHIERNGVNTHTHQIGLSVQC